MYIRFFESMAIMWARMNSPAWRQNGEYLMEKLVRPETGGSGAGVKPPSQEQ